MGLESEHGHHFSMGLGMGTQKNSRAHLYLFIATFLDLDMIPGEFVDIKV